jgi:putative salt-induced outer membrane protein YdiY
VPGQGGAKDEDNALGWTAKAALSYVGTGGNAEATSLGFKFNASYNWTRTYFTLLGGGVRADSTTTERFAYGPSQNEFTTVEVENKETTAENYVLDSTLDHNVTKRFYWQAGAGWLRNTFSGVDSRTAARAGVGYFLTDPDSKGAQLKGALLATLTHQKEVVSDPSTHDTFVGLRGLLNFVTNFGPGDKSSFTSRLALDENLQTTEDFRGTWWNSLGVSMTDRFALQVSLGVVFDNQPALGEVPLYGSISGGVPVGPATGSILVPLKKWDREFSVSLVLNLVPKKPAPPPPPPCAPCK